MFVTAPPRPHATAGAQAPCLARVVHLAFGPGDGQPVAQYPPGILRYLEDMVTQYGVPYSEERFAAGNHLSYAYLGERLLAEAGTTPDLMLIAHAAPDCEPGRSVSGHLSELVAGEPLVYAVSDQGELSPFSALRLLRTYLAAGTHHDALLLILDQSTQAFPGFRPARDEHTDHAIGLVLGGTGDGPALTAVAQRFDVAPTELTAALGELAAGLPATAGPVTVITTEAVLRHAELPATFAGQLRVAERGPRCVPPWATLATLLAEGVTGRIALIEYDETLTGLAIAVFDAPELEAGR